MSFQHRIKLRWLEWKIKRLAIALDFAVRQKLEITLWG